jgi:hypothetical protein
MTTESKKARRFVMKEFGWSAAELDHMLQAIHIDDLVDFALRNPLRQSGSQPCG